MLERFARPRLHEHVQRLVHDLAPPGPFLFHGGVLERPIAEPHRDDDASLADQVEHGEVFRHSNRIVEREEEGTNHAEHMLGAGQHQYALIIGVGDHPVPLT